jgi:hypothetical protein
MSVSGGAATELTVDGTAASKSRPYALCATGVGAIEETSTRDSLEIDDLEALAVHPELATEPTLEELRSRFPEARIGETRAPEERVGDVCGTGSALECAVVDSSGTAGFGVEIQNRPAGLIELWLVNSDGEYHVATDEQAGFEDPSDDSPDVVGGPGGSVLLRPQDDPPPITSHAWGDVEPGSYAVELRGEADVFPTRCGTPVEKTEDGEGGKCSSCEPDAPPLPEEDTGGSGDDPTGGAVRAGLPGLEDAAEFVLPAEGSDTPTVGGISVWALLVALLIGATIAAARGQR